MYSVMLKLFFIFNVLVLSEVVGNDVGYTESADSHPYNIQNIYRRLHRTISSKDKSLALAEYFLFNPVDRESVRNELTSLSETSQCLKDIIYVFESLKNASSNPWALSMLDSFAKPESGILQGNFFWVGEYNECINVYAPSAERNGSTVGNFHGQYCSLAYNLPVFKASFPLKFGLCLPDSCSPLDLQNKLLQLLVQAGGFSHLSMESLLQMPIIACSPRERHLNAGSISVIVLMSIFCAFAFVASTFTVVKYVKKQLQADERSSLVVNIHDSDITDPEGTPSKHIEPDKTSLIHNSESSGKGGFEAFLNCFCVFTNGAKLLNTDSSEGQLMCIHGIRFLSMSWVILGHAYIFNFSEIRNTAATLTILDDFPFQIVLQGFFSVDSFFVLSGFLLSYLSMKEFSKTKGSINWIYFYIHRYIRLTPIYMVVLGFSAAVFYYLGSGPYWPVGDYDPGCRKTWWWNLLYINNFADQTEQCMGWAWYLANDMQFFVISPIFLITLWRWPKIGYGLLGIFFLACMLSNFFITYHFDLMVGLVGLGSDVMKTQTAQTMVKFLEFFDKIYIKPYTRIGPYLAGVLVGYILYKHKTTNRPKLNRITLYIGWLVATVVTLTCVYGLYHSHPSLLARSFYNTFNRTLFGFGLTWVIYVCLTNQSDVINRILSYKLFIPLSRLTYSAYLIHPMIISGYYASLKKPFEFSHPSVVIVFLGFMVVTYALALPVSLIFESPIVSLEKMIRNKFNKKTESAG